MPYDGKTTDCLPTPCGAVMVLDSEHNHLSFSVRRSGSESGFSSCSGRVLTTPYRYIISVPASALEKGKDYRIVLVGMSLEIGDCDECTQCVFGSADGWSLSLGAIDPNVTEKTAQVIALRGMAGLGTIITDPPEFDLRGFSRYHLQMLSDHSGYRFCLLDDSVEEIIFPVAWINDSTQDGLDAVQFWTI